MMSLIEGLQLMIIIELRLCVILYVAWHEKEGLQFNYFNLDSRKPAI